MLLMPNNNGYEVRGSYNNRGEFFSSSPTNTDYRTVEYNSLERNVFSNCIIAMKGFLVQKGYSQEFMRRITTGQFSDFAREWSRTQKTVETIIREQGLARPLGIADIDLHEPTEERERPRGYRVTPQSLRDLHNHSDMVLSQEQLESYQRFVEQHFTNTPTASRGVGVAVSGLQSNSRPRRPRRSERDMLLSVIKSEDFPKPNFVNWSSQSDLSEIIDDWYQNVEYKEQWIFSRREREGFNRRNIGHFSLEEVKAKLNKRKSNIYDWKLGGTDWVLRLELHEVDREEHGLLYYLITRYIHKPTNKEVKFDVRYWTGTKFNSLINMWSQYKDNERVIARTLADLPDYEDEIEESHDIDEELEYNPFEPAEVRQAPSYTYRPSFYGVVDNSEDEDEDEDEDIDELITEEDWNSPF